MRFEIDTTELSKDERNERAKMFFKSGYGIRLVKAKDGSKIKYIIVCEKGA
jgi:hypothetical protein